MKSNQFIYVKPKNSEAKEVFQYDMRGLHSCKILQRNGTDMLVKSIAGDFYFQIDTDNDKNWELLK
jgi:hypothetical protein